MLRVLFLSLLVAGSSATCDFESLANCLIPTSGSDFCQVLDEYRQCVTDADCLSQAQPRSILEGRDASACKPPITDPRIYTDSKGIHLETTKESQDVCMHTGSKTLCMSDIEINFNDVKEEQGDLNESLETLANKTADQIQGNQDMLKELNDSLRETISKSEEASESMYNELTEKHDGLCGRLCYPGEYVSKPCSADSDTICSQCDIGKFSFGGLNRKCSDCTECSMNQRKTGDCSKTADTECTDCTCPEGQYAAKQCKDETTDHCKKYTECESGKTYLFSAGNEVEDNTCKQCDTCKDGETFATKKCTAASNTECTACSECKAGEKVKTKCTPTSDTVCVDDTYDGYGGDWRIFWKWNGENYKGAKNKPPQGTKSVFEKPYGSCKSTDQYCFGRLPDNVDEFETEILAMDKPDGSGNVYYWFFDPANPTSHNMFSAMKYHQLVGFNTGRHSAAFDATVLNGIKSPITQDSVQFRPSTNGFWTFQMDDDNCYCHTTLEMGYDLCGGGQGTTFGVELMDQACGRPSTDNSLYLFFRTGVRKSPYGTGWNQFWHFTSGYGRERDMLGLEYEKCLFSKTSNGLKWTPQVCPGRMPTNLFEPTTEMLATDRSGTVFKWKFNPQCNTAHEVYKAFTKGWVGRVRHLRGCNWRPTVLRGTSTWTSQNSFNYLECAGTRSFIIDDDGCYCHTTLEAGSRICSGGNCNSGTYGVDILGDRGCNHVYNDMNTRQLVLYFRDCLHADCD